MDGFIINDKFMPARTVNSLYGTSSVTKLKKQGILAEPHYDEGKYLYWKAIDREGILTASKMELGKSKYAKPKIIHESVISQQYRMFTDDGAEQLQMFT